MIIEYHPAIALELGEIRSFYNQRSSGLGEEFVDEFERQVLVIAAAPERWMAIERDIRRSMLKRFPFVIYFRHTSPDRIRVTAVKPQRRHPAYGRDRQ